MRLCEGVLGDTLRNRASHGRAALTRSSQLMALRLEESFFLDRPPGTVLLPRLSLSREKFSPRGDLSMIFDISAQQRFH